MQVKSIVFMQDLGKTFYNGCKDVYMGSSRSKYRKTMFLCDIRVEGASKKGEIANQ